MGHSCYSCKTKLMGGISPNTCGCIESYCNGCWNRLFDSNKYNQITEEVFIKRGNEYIPLEKQVYEKEIVTPKCPRCREEYNNIEGEGWEYYG